MPTTTRGARRFRWAGRAVLATATAALAALLPATVPPSADATTLGVLQAPALALTADTDRAGPAAPTVLALVTGDHAIVHPGGRQVGFRPGPGRAAMSYRSLVLDRHHYLIPADAQLLVASGALDPRLFDVTALVASTTGTPLRVTADRGIRQQSVPPGATGIWDALTEPVPEARGVRLGSRRLRAGVRTVTLDTSAAAAPARSAAIDDVRLTITYRDRDGRATAAAYSMLRNIDDPSIFSFVVAGADGTATVRVPVGRYFLESLVDTARPGTDNPSTSVTVNPQLTVEGDTRLTVDARTAGRVAITVPDRAAIGVAALAGYRRSVNGGQVLSVLGNPDVNALYTAHQGPEVPAADFESVVGAYFARPGPAGTTTDSPLTYAAAWQRTGRFFTGYQRRLAETDLSTVRVEHGTVTPGRSAQKAAVAVLPSMRVGQSLDLTTLPFTRVERYAGTVHWANTLTEYATGTDLADAVVQEQNPTAYLPRRRYDEQWNATPYWPAARAVRDGDLLFARLAMYCDRSGLREGTGSYRRAQVRLDRDGELVGESDRLDGLTFRLPSSPGRYRLAADVERDWTDVATRISTVWTFTSSPGASGGSETLPLMSVRFVPRDGATGRPAGTLSVHVMRATPGPAVRSLAVDVSYDRGRTWRPARLTGAGDRWTATLPDQPGDGSVSLRARATDSADDTVEQTTIDAYRPR